VIVDAASLTLSKRIWSDFTGMYCWSSDWLIKDPNRGERSMPQKIVINACYGGFSVSMEAARFMAERGNQFAIEEIREYEEKLNDVTKWSKVEKEFGVKFYGYSHDCYKMRTDHDLIAAVEELGESANGRYASLKVIEIPNRIEWMIDEYDGKEFVTDKIGIWRRLL
jgi:hypothetical protein